MPTPLSIGRCAEIACILEATARKPGNVHPGASFPDMTYDDLIRSAAAIAPVMERAVELGVGRTVLAAIQATRKVVNTNTNLGIVLLLAPLAAVGRRSLLEETAGSRDTSGAPVRDVLRATTVQDAELVYEAVRLAKAGGLGTVAEQDVWAPPTATLFETMKLAAAHDSIASQYAEGFRLVFEFGLPLLADDFRRGRRWEDAVIDCCLRWMYRCPDSLIERKLGADMAVEAGRRAKAALDLRETGHAFADAELARLDAWLRADGNRRNPGTSADLTAATLFAALREGTIALDFEPVGKQL